MSLSEQELIRREKLNKLTAMGINAFPADEYTISDTTKSIKENFGLLYRNGCHTVYCVCRGDLL